jgi:hypothetical protein
MMLSKWAVSAVIASVDLRESMSLLQTRAQRSATAPRPKRDRGATDEAHASFAGTTLGPPPRIHQKDYPMAVTALLHPARRTFSRLVVVALVLVIALTTFLVVRASDSATSAKPSTPAASIPSPNGSGFVGTVNSGADDPAARTTPGAGNDLTCAKVVPHSHIC